MTFSDDKQSGFLDDVCVKEFTTPSGTSSSRVYVLGVKSYSYFMLLCYFYKQMKLIQISYFKRQCLVSG